MGTEMACQPAQASCISCGLRLSARTRLMALMSRQSSVPVFFGHHLPRPYWPSSEEARRVSSAESRAWGGAATVSPRRSSRTCRARSAGSLFTLANRVAFFA
jgi:hypothetical protein